MIRIWHALLVLLGRRVAVAPDAADQHERMRKRCQLLALKLKEAGGGCAGASVGGVLLADGSIQQLASLREAGNA
jgi:hypothetical protein